jgi:microsomal epoxide hydrolase
LEAVHDYGNRVIMSSYPLLVCKRLTPLVTIRIPDAILADLRARLDRVRWPDAIPGAGWQYGTDLTYLRQLVEYWRTQYDWRVHEARLNAFQ